MTVEQDPVMQTAVEGFMTSLAAVEEWDNPPLLALVTAPPGAGRTATLSYVRFGDDIWDMAPPARMLSAMAMAMHRNPDVLPPMPVTRPRGHILLGVALGVEAWTVEIRASSGVEADRIRAEYDRIEDHPGRVEKRLVVAVDRRGRTYMADQRRDTGEIRLNPFAEFSDEKVEGELHRVLTELLEALIDHPHLTGGGKR